MNFFRIVNKMRAQIYYLLLSIIYRIYNIFHIFLLKLYYNRDYDDASKFFMQVFELIDNDEF